MKCSMCRGVGSHGEPPIFCQWCKGTGKYPWQAAPQPEPQVTAPLDAVEALRETVRALLAAEHWLNGWASAEPYLTTIRDARIKGDAVLAAMSAGSTSGAQETP